MEYVTTTIAEGDGYLLVHKDEETNETTLVTNNTVISRLIWLVINNHVLNKLTKTRSSEYILVWDRLGLYYASEGMSIEPRRFYEEFDHIHHLNSRLVQLLNGPNEIKYAGHKRIWHKKGSI